MAAMVAGSVSFGFFMDPVTAEMGYSRSAFSLVFSLVTVVGAITLPFYGRLINKVGSRKLVIWGGAWTALTMAALSLSQSLLMFYAIACLIGLGFFGCSYIAAPVIVDTWFRKKNASIMGAAAACGGLCGVVAGLLFPNIIAAFGWRVGYVCMGVLVGLLTVPAGVFLLHSRPEDVGVAPYGADELQAPLDEAGSRVQDEQAATWGYTRSEAVRLPSFWVCVLVFTIVPATVIVSQHLPAHFVSVGFDGVMAGMFMSVISAGIVVTNMAAGTLCDKVGLLKGLVIISIVYALSFVLLPAVGSSFAGICVALIMMSLGNAFPSLLAPMVTGVVFGNRDYASIWGIVSMACVLGQAAGAPIWGLSFDFTGGYQFGMQVAVVVIIVALALVVMALRSNSASKQSEGGA